MSDEEDQVLQRLPERVEIDTDTYLAIELCSSDDLIQAAGVHAANVLDTGLELAAMAAEAKRPVRLAEFAQPDLT